jgi:hypothetical protein
MNNDPRYNTGDCLRDAFRFLADASFAIFPRDAAYKLGEFEKNFWGGVRWCAERSIERIDEALAGGDRLREEWRRRRDAGATATGDAATGGPAPAADSPAGGL